MLNCNINVQRAFHLISFTIILKIISNYYVTDGTPTGIISPGQSETGCSSSEELC